MHITVNNNDLHRERKNPFYRLKIFRNAINRTQHDFASLIGLIQPYYSKLESGKIEISISTLITIQEAFDMSLNWYATGRGPMFCYETFDMSVVHNELTPIKSEEELLNDLSLKNVPENENYVHLNTVQQQNIASEPMFEYKTIGNKKSDNILVPVAAFGGYLGEWTQEYIDQDLVYVDIPGSPRDARTFEISGTSMEPVIMSGDYVVTKRIEKFEHIKKGHMYVIISLLQGITVKYVYDNGDSLILEPANRLEHIPLVISKADIREIWQVVLRLTKHIIDTEKALYQVQKTKHNPNTNTV